MRQVLSWALARSPGRGAGRARGWRPSARRACSVRDRACGCVPRRGSPYRPAEAVSAIEATLKGERLVPAGQAVTITASVPHGHVAAVHAAAVELGLPALLGPAGRARRAGPGTWPWR
jgi:hypothetical protein